jgi:Kef-type K+ transport system membrane component KefB
VRASCRLFSLLGLHAVRFRRATFGIRLRQPRVIGEIVAGVTLGPSVIGHFGFGARVLEAAQRNSNVLNFVYWLGLLLRMFLSGAETRQLFTRDERFANGGAARGITRHMFISQTV